jgi:hypothetical protein
MRLPCRFEPGKHYCVDPNRRTLTGRPCTTHTRLRYNTWQEETVNTLKYASNARRIKNKPTINQDETETKDVVLPPSLPSRAEPSRAEPSRAEPSYPFLALSPHPTKSNECC